MPLLSVIVPSFQRPDLVAQLVELLRQQTLAPERFELVLVDDGSEPPLALAGDTPFACTLLRQENAGPAAARNLALEHARGRWCLILNDDALPARDLCERHLALHQERERAGQAPVALLGTFHFAPRAIAASPFVELLDKSDLLFDFSALKHGELHGWQSFWTCNLSLETALVRDAGGFDPAFRDAVAEDVELGWRLEQRGVRVLFRGDLVAHHDHVWTPAAYFARAEKLGAALVRMHRKHGTTAPLRLQAGEAVDAAFLRKLQATCESLHPSLAKVELLLARLEGEQRGRPLAPELVRQLAPAVARVQSVPLCRGMLRALSGHDPIEVIERGPRGGRLTSVIVVSHDALAATRECIEALRRHTEREHPLELVVVDNGSRDGSREWLAAQPDVLLIANDDNAGAPRARNQALERARGEFVVFLDNDVVVTPRWLSRLLFHADVDPRAACIGPLCDRAAHGQAIEFTGGDAELDTFADARSRSHARQFRLATLLSSFCLLVRRELVLGAQGAQGAQGIGGFDERFSPWGFEDDDFTLRAALSGGHNRVALDVFVRHRAYGSATKSAAHQKLLARNWRRFAEKWELPAGAAHGDYRALEALVAKPPEHARLFVALPHTAPRPEPATRPLAGASPCAT